MSGSGRIAGRCLCGAVQVSVDGHDRRVGACHCRMCQRWTGGLFTCFTAPWRHVKASGPIRVFASSALAERAFCATCGSHLWMRDTGPDSDECDLMPGLFDQARDWPLRSEIYIDRALASVRLGGDHPRVAQAEYERTNPHVDEGDRP